MTIALFILAGLLLLTGFVGCVLPVLPGPIIGYCGLLALIPTEKCPSTLVLVTIAFWGNVPDFVGTRPQWRWWFLAGMS